MKKNNSPRKKVILKEAEALFAEKGFFETTISDISSAVGIRQSTTYEHFENKAKILFTIPKERIEKIIHTNQQNLTGLLGPKTKLRKLIWNYMDFLVNDKAFTNLLVFELRPNREFYGSESYTLIRQFTQPYRQAILEGQDNLEFRNDIDPSVILDLIFGTIDLILITWLSEDNPKDPLALFEKFFDLLSHAIINKNLDPRPRDKTKLILNAAVTIFSRIGYQKTRIQDIAKLAGVGDATIYKYFSSKEEILLCLPIEHTKKLLAIQKEHLNGIMGSALKLSVLIRDYIHYLEIHKAYSSVCLFELRYNRLFYQTEAYNLFRESGRLFYDVITDGIKLGHFRDSVDPYIATKMILGVIDHILLSWLIFRKPERITNYSNQIYNLILSSLKGSYYRNEFLENE